MRSANSPPRPPAPVIAGALGFNHTTTHRQHIKAGATWSRYTTRR